MTISTLGYIYGLLRREVSSLEAEYHKMRDARAALDYDDPGYQAIDKACKDANSLFCDARDALIEFSSKEW